MRFGPVALDAAEGAVLAHSVPLERGRLRKGTLLGAGEVAALRDAGVTTVVVARLEPGDVGEDAAAARLASAMVPDPEAAGLRIGKAATGRVNIHAEVPGVLEVDAARVDRVNALDPMVTLATLPRWQRVAAGSMVATVKIISYAVEEGSVRGACDAAPGALRVRPVQSGSAKLIQTRVREGESGEKGQRAMKTRLDRLGVALGSRQVIAHKREALAEAIEASDEEVVLILTGSATSDPDDVAPGALRDAGGTVTHFGMPVDPGNLLFFGSHRGRPVIGLPGCARSPALNGADWVLERLLCGVALSSADIMGMGVGGLLKESPARGRPREG